MMNISVKKWYNVELNQDDAKALHTYLMGAGIKHETSACGIWSIHFEIELEPNSKEFNKVNGYIERL